MTSENYLSKGSGISWLVDIINMQKKPALKAPEKIYLRFKEGFLVGHSSIPFFCYLLIMRLLLNS